MRSSTSGPAALKPVCTDPSSLPHGGKNTQNYTKKIYFNDPDNHYGVITQLEPDILESKVKRALGSITTNKASGGDEFQLSYFKS